VSPVLLVIDDDISVLAACRRYLAPSCTLLEAATAAEGVRLAVAHRPDVIILDPDLSDLPGEEVFHQVRAFDAQVPVIFLAEHGTAQAAIDAMKLGAFDYLLKPVSLPLLTAAIQRAGEMRTLAARASNGTVAGEEATIVGRCQAMQDVFKAMGRIAMHDLAVLILGERGTGKELVARAIHHNSRRAHGPFKVVRCAGVPATRLEQELFGHENAADQHRIGLFQQCNGGTLFLDEIGDAPPEVQEKLLHLLQGTIQSDVRVLAATTRAVEDLVVEGRFRADLFFRLSACSLYLPPLRERGEDLPLLVEHLIRRFSRELNRPDIDVGGSAMHVLSRYPWPGNVGELQDVLGQAVRRTSGTQVLPESLPESVREGKQTPLAVGPPHGLALPQLRRFMEDRVTAGTKELYTEVQEVVERQLFTFALQQTRGNQLRAARLLGIARGKLRSKLRRLKISPARSFWSQPPGSSLK
jgi:DNA-binding NtrC family response regulator